MIHSINSDHVKFKKIEFHKGLNVVLADRTNQSSQKDSRNGLGKTTMINIIHFCLGANLNSSLKNPKLENSMFIIELDLNGKKYKVSRSVGNVDQIFIDGDFSDWPIQPKIDTDTQKKYLKRDHWRNVLAKFMFDLPVGLGSFHPKFGSLISYFIRRDEGFLDAFKHTSVQLTWDVQTNNAYLLDLGWKFATDLQILKKKKIDLDAFKREITTGQFAGFMGNVSKLEVEKAKLQIESDKQKEKLNDFKINDQYEQIEKKSNDITVKIHNYVDQNIIDKLLLRRYDISLEDEKVVDVQYISDIYKESGIYFSTKIMKTIEEVNDFHNNIIKNRKEFLNLEITRLNNKIDGRILEIEQLDIERSRLMKILSTQGALKEYTEIQKNYVDSKSVLNDIRSKLNNLKNIEDQSTEIKLEKQKLYKNARMDMNERTEQKDNAIRIFGEFSRNLYDEFGDFLIDINENGFQFNINIPRSSSRGIGNMKIFCYDLMLAKIWSMNKQSPGFLIHDSTIFDGVDERQRASALQLVSEVSEKENFQYICTLNTDMIPSKDLKKDFDLQKYVVRTFVDSTEDGGILGVRL